MSLGSKNILSIFPLKTQDQQTEHAHTRCARPAGAGVWEGLDPAGRVAGGEHGWGIRGESSRLLGD